MVAQDTLTQWSDGSSGLIVVEMIALLTTLAHLGGLVESFTGAQ